MIEYGRTIGPGGDGAWRCKVDGRFVAGPFEDEHEARAHVRRMWPGQPYVQTVFALPAGELPPPGHTDLMVPPEELDLLLHDDDGFPKPTTALDALAGALMDGGMDPADALIEIGGLGAELMPPPF